MALDMVAQGASDKTRDEFDRVLHLQKGEDLFFAKTYMSEHTQRWVSEKRPAYSLETGNRLFLQSGVTLQKRFTDLLAENFSSTVGEVDYKKNTEDARNTINEWTS